MSTSSIHQNFSRYRDWYALSVKKEDYPAFQGRSIKEKKVLGCFFQFYFSEKPAITWIQNHAKYAFMPLKEEGGLTAIHAAAMRGQGGALRVLLEKDPTKALIKDKSGYNLLHHAAMCGTLDSITESIQDLFEQRVWKQLWETEAAEDFTPASIQQMLTPCDALAPFYEEGERSLRYLTKEEFRKKSGGAEYTDKFVTTAQTLIQVWKKSQSYSSEEKEAYLERKKERELVEGFITQISSVQEVEKDSLAFYWDKNIQGLGVRSIKKIPKGNYLPYYGELRSFQDNTWEERVYASRYGDRYLMQVQALKKRSLASCINSGWPNVYFMPKKELGYGSVPVFLAPEEIKPGEKIQTFFPDRVESLGRYYLSKEDWDKVAAHSFPGSTHVKSFCDIYILVTPAALMYKKLLGQLPKSFEIEALQDFSVPLVKENMGYFFQMDWEKVDASLKEKYLKILRRGQISILSLIKLMILLSIFPENKGSLKWMEKVGKIQDIIYELIYQVPYGNIGGDPSPAIGLSIERKRGLIASMYELLDSLLSSSEALFTYQAFQMIGKEVLKEEEEEPWKIGLKQRIYSNTFYIKDAEEKHA